MIYDEGSIFLDTHNVKVSYKKWQNGSEPVIALHGWLDNANSFDLLAPLLNDHVSFYALDLCGHGLSDHLPAGAEYTITSAIGQILEFAKMMRFDSFHLVGHSLGAGVATLIAGTIPKRVKTLTLIEGIGPISYSSKDLPQRILNHFKIKSRKLITQKPLYSSLEEAAKDRNLKSGLPYEASCIIAARGIEKGSSESYTWRTDSRLLIPTAHPLTEEDTLIFLERIQAPTLLIVASKGLLTDYKVLNQRVDTISHCMVKDLKGGHHIHMESPEEVAKIINPHILGISSR